MKSEPQPRLAQVPMIAKVDDALPGVAANRQVCPTFSEMSFGNRYKRPKLQTPSPT